MLGVVEEGVEAAVQADAHGDIRVVDRRRREGVLAEADAELANVFEIVHNALGTFGRINYEVHGVPRIFMDVKVGVDRTAQHVCKVEGSQPERSQSERSDSSSISYWVCVSCILSSVYRSPWKNR